MKNTKPNQALILAISILLSLGIGFYGGTKYQTNNKPDFVNQFSNNGRNTGGQQRPQGNTRPSGATQNGQMMRGGFRPIIGEIISSDTKNITVKQVDGSNKIVFLSTSTEINKAQKAMIVDLRVGEKVSVFGTSNPDGSVVAQSIQLNPTIPNASPSAQPR